MSERAMDALPRWRLPAVLVVLGILLALLTWRLLSLQVLNTERGYEFLQGQGDARAIRTEVIPAHRGQIVDRNGEPLAISTPVVSIWANPSEVKAARQRWPELARKIGLEQSSLEEKLSYQGKHFVYLRRHLPPPEAAAVMALKLPGIYAQREYRRFYPAGEVTAHILGFTDVDDHGQEGLELAYDNYLSGTPGSKRVLKELTGKIIREIDAGQPAKPGKDLTLSIDLRLQYLAYRELRNALQDMGASAGSVVMLDSHTGEVLAMASQPSFNPNNRARANSNGLRNRAMLDLIEPGSTMKPLTMVAALESGQYTPQTMVDASPGYLSVDGKVLKDPVNFGLIDLTKIITKSSQIGMTRVALTLDEKKMVDVSRRFGLGSGMDTGFPGEQHGVLPARNRWSDIERATYAFGYGLQVTPLQLARAYSVFASGGRLRPVSLLKRDGAAPEGEQVVSAGVAQQIVDMMKTVVEPGGTGVRAKIPAYSVAGKTGTVHMVGVHGYEDRYHSLFAGLAPTSAPRIVTVVVVDDASLGKYHGGDVAAPVFAKVVGGAMRLLNIAPDITPQQAVAKGATPPVDGKGPV
ncbi:MAG TPA: penicillin-binding transpeptidase domain-containing protein [Spongiibacteraceae bacterium]|nr:penicillin-binding transpeptidase domain-containing protein [Spongiibacteraceae bacterium]